MIRVLGLFFAVWVAVCPALAAPPVPTDSELAFFGLTFLDTSTEGDIMGENAEETRRLEMLEQRNLLADALEGMSTATLEYKGLAEGQSAMCAWLRGE